MARKELQTEDFAPDVHFPVGLKGPDIGIVNPGDPPIRKYRKTNFCTPFCSLYKPGNLWTEIRMNFGVQMSREFLAHLLDTLGDTIFDDLGSIKGLPELAFDRIHRTPRGYVLSFFKAGNGHAVTPYAWIPGNPMNPNDQIRIYDNNDPEIDTRFIDLVDGEYDYPAAPDGLTHGKGMVAYPISIWQKGRHLLGLGELSSLIDGGLVEFLFMIVVGSADTIVTNDSGGRWGWEDDGSFTDSLLGAVSIPPLGPSDVDLRAMPLLVAMNQPAPRVQVNADGGRYLFQSGAGGHLFQLEASDAIAGDKDQIQLGYAGGDLDSFAFIPQRNASHLVPRIGLAIDEEESALFHWLGLAVPGGASVGFGAAKDTQAVTYHNDTGAPTHHVMTLDHGSGSAGVYGRMIYGPFEVPDGAAQRVTLASWPEVAEVVSELDFDRDGTADHSMVVKGRSATPPVDLGSEADISVAKTVSSESLSLGESVEYAVTVRNDGPADATGVWLVDALPAHASISTVQSSRGNCEPDTSGVSCDLGDLLAGDAIDVTYVVTPTLPGALVNGATAFGNEGDSDVTNNTAVVATLVPVVVDIEPDSDRNAVNPKGKGVIPVAILGEPGFDVSQIDSSTLTFGPAGATLAHKKGGHLDDVDADGDIDLLSHYDTPNTGISFGDTETCVHGRFHDGRAFDGCDSVRTVSDRER
jgi:uncharacterized repeat protein (TIGR01451 family)